jgi:hypothetical protein
MIEVVRKGSLKRIECSNCGSVLRYDANEDIQTTEQKHELGTFTKKIIVCPECGCEIVLTEKELDNNKVKELKILLEKLCNYSLREVRRACDGIGVSLCKENGDYKSMCDVIEELHKKFYE